MCLGIKRRVFRQSNTNLKMVKPGTTRLCLVSALLWSYVRAGAFHDTSASYLPEALLAVGQPSSTRFCPLQQFDHRSDVRYVCQEHITWHRCVTPLNSSRRLTEANGRTSAISDLGEFVTSSVEIRRPINPHTFQNRRLHHSQHWSPRCNVVLVFTRSVCRE